MLDIGFAKSALPKSGALVLLVEEADILTADLLGQADEATNGAISRALTAAEFKGKAGSNVTILAPGAGLSRVIAIGIGKLDDLSQRLAEEAGGAAVPLLAKDEHAHLAAGGLSAERAASVAMGAALRSYRFDRYRTKEKAEDKPRLSKLVVMTAHPVKAREAWVPLKATVEGVFVTRDLVSEPPNVLYPAEMADRCKALESLGLKVDVLGPKEMSKLGFGALLGVAQGSEREARMVVLQWNGASGEAAPTKGKKGKAAKIEKADNAPLAFIGKGVTFDTGGISIKPAAGMEDMKWDMAGAGAVIGLMATLAGRKAKVDAVGLVGLVENMPSGTAMRPGDVVTSASGQTVEVLNTDAEGRLVLADVIHYCQENFKPRLMIDLATLTGAIIVAYDKQLKSDIADMKNIGGRWGGAIIAAQFIQRFVTGGTPWVHLDIAGTAWSSKDTATVPKGATAFGVRLLDRLVAAHYETN